MPARFDRISWLARIPVWLARHVAMATSQLIPVLLAAILDLAFPFVYAALILREIVGGRDWRNPVALGRIATDDDPGG